MLDLTKLSDAVTKVAGLATARDAACARADKAEAAIAVAQSDIDALAAQLIAAVDTPAEAVGLAAVAAAVSVDAPAPEVAPLTLEELNERIAAQNAGISALG